MILFVIEDQAHAAIQSVHYSFQEALRELRRIARLPYVPPNVAPCGNPDCSLDYEIIEYDSSSTPWVEVRRYGGVEVSVSGAKWADARFEFGT